jgi:hypothetical protein
MSGDPATYAGHRARVSHDPRLCTGYRADLSTRVDVFTDANHGYSFNLCGRGPGTEVMQRQFDALLQSLRVAP